MHVSGHATRGPRPHTARTRFAVSGFSRLVCLVLLVSAVASLLSPHSPAAAQTAAYIDTDVLNLRDGPGTWAGVVSTMWQGEPVSVLDGPTDDGWYQVDYFGQVGWAYGGYLSIGGDPGAASGAAVGGSAWQAWVATDVLNVRADASLNASVIDGVTEGDAVAVVGDAVNGFVPIDYNGGRAWVHGDYLAFDGPAAAEAGPERWIDVDRSSQTVTLYVGDEAVASHWAALGWDNSRSGFYSTAIGTYYVYGMHEGLTWTEWGQAYISYWVGFDPSRVNGFHSFSMDSKGRVLKNGDGPTGGCVALEPSAARELFNFASEGMRVEVHK